MEQTKDTKTFATYDKIDNLIIFAFHNEETGELIHTFRIAPELFLDALDVCLLIRLKQTELLKFGTLTKLMKRLEELSIQAKEATTKFDLLKIKQEKECLAQMRYLVKYKEMEQRRIKEEMLERQM